MAKQAKIVSAIEEIKVTIIRDQWGRNGAEKATRYVGKFFDCQRTGKKIIGKVVGNHGTHTVSLSVKAGRADGACNCYVGRDGCHHCDALAKTFPDDPESFVAVAGKRRRNIRTLDDLASYLKGVTLARLIDQMKERGVTQTAFAESIGMNPRHLAAIKSSEARHRYFNDLGATKLAVLWMIENVEVDTASGTRREKKK